MKKLYEKNELTFAIVWIVIYCVLQSLANSFNEIIGIEYSANAVLCILQTIVLFAFIKKHNLSERYGLYKSSIPASRFLYYIPLIIFASGNLWHGIALNYSWMATVCRITCMLRKSMPDYLCHCCRLPVCNALLSGRKSASLHHRPLRQ